MVIDVLRTICMFFDQLIYGLIVQIYNLFVMLTEATIFTQADIKGFATRLYALISLVMVFKLAFSFISYIVNPEALVDKQKGGAKLVTNIVIAIALLASTPLIFNEAYYVQGVIVKEGVIEKLVLGASSNYSANKPEQLLATYSFLTFFAPNPNLSSCASADATTISDDCISKLNEADENVSAGTIYSKSINSGELTDLWSSSQNMVNLKASTVSKASGTKTDYVFNYQFGISTVVGIVLCLVLLNFCLDIAIRVVKLGFLQLIAPIPIILSISPGKKNNPLSTWGKECLQTYASLFLRTAVIYFALSILGTINKGGGVISFVSGGSNTNPFVKIFLIFGVLLFAKEFPKLLEELLGMKAAGKFSLNPLKRMGEAPILGGLTKKAAGAAGAGLSFAGNSARNLGAWAAGKTVGRLAGLDQSKVNDKLRQRTGFALDEARGRYASGGLAADKKYSGDTQWKSMHKSNLDEGKKIREQKRVDKQLEAQEQKGGRAYKNVTDKNIGVKDANGNDAKVSAKDYLDRLANGQDVSDSEKEKIYSAYDKAYGTGHSKTARAEAQLAIAKSKDEFYKKSVSQLQRMAEANPNDTELTKQLNVTMKAQEDNMKTISGLDEKIKGLAITDSKGAEITKGIKLAKGKSYQGDQTFATYEKTMGADGKEKKVTVGDVMSGINSSTTSQQGTNNGQPNNFESNNNQNDGQPNNFGSNNNQNDGQPNNFGSNNNQNNGSTSSREYIIGENGSPFIDLNGNPIKSKNTFADNTTNTTAADYEGDSGESADKAIYEQTRSQTNVDATKKQQQSRFDPDAK